MAVTSPSITPWVIKANPFSHSSNNLLLLFSCGLSLPSLHFLSSVVSKTGHRIPAVTSQCWIDLNNHPLCLVSRSVINPSPNCIFFMGLYSFCGLLQSFHLFFFSAAFCINLYWIILCISNNFFNLSTWSFILVTSSKYQQLILQWVFAECYLQGFLAVVETG